MKTVEKKKTETIDNEVMLKNIRKGRNTNPEKKDHTNK